LILDSKSTTCFRLPKEKELCHYGKCRIKLQIMEIYDRMRHAIDSRLSLKATYARPTRREHGNFLLLLDGQMILTPDVDEPKRKGSFEVCHLSFSGLESRG